MNNKINKLSKIEHFDATTDVINTAVKNIYLADIDAIRNLSAVATSLSAGGWTVPGNLTVSGNNIIQEGNVYITSNKNDTTAAINTVIGQYLSIEAFNLNNSVKRPICLNSWGGNVGIGTTDPKYKLDVNGDTQINGSAQINGNLTVTGTSQMIGGSKIVVQNNQNGGKDRGIYMWNSGDTNWGIYMAQSGTKLSLADGVACAGNNFSSHAIRFRVYNHDSAGFIFENHNEKLLASINGASGDAYFAGNLKVNGSATFGGGIGAYMIDGGCCLFPIFSSMNNYGMWGMNDRDDAYLLLPGYKIIVYRDGYDSDSCTFDNTNGTSTTYNTLPKNSNSGTSCRLYYLGNEVKINGLS